MTLYYLMRIIFTKIIMKTLQIYYQLHRKFEKLQVKLNRKMIYYVQCKLLLFFFLDINVTINSRIIIVAIDDRLIDSFLHEFKELAKKIIELSPQSICIVATYPVDFLTYFTCIECTIKVNRIFGIGTALESQQFRLFIAKLFDTSPQIIYGNIIGSHNISMGRFSKTE